MSPQELQKEIGRLIAETLREFEQATGMRVYSLEIDRALSTDQSFVGKIQNVQVEIGTH